MLPVVLFISLLAGFTAAQNSSSKFDANSVSLTQKNQWCNGERNNCPKLCGGPGFIKDNTCDGASLKYVCTCSNGTGPTNIDQYLDTLPNYICQETFRQCNQDAPGSSECETCGTLKVADVQPSTSSSSAAATSTSAATAAGTEAPSASATGAAAHLSAQGMGYALWGWGVLAAGVGTGALVL